jgi:DNA modification methylase
VGPVNAATLLADLRRRGVILTANDGALNVDAPRAVVTPDLRQALIDRKAELLRLLTCMNCGAPLPAESQSRCAACAAAVSPDTTHAEVPTTTTARLHPCPDCAQAGREKPIPHTCDKCATCDPNWRGEHQRAGLPAGRHVDPVAPDSPASQATGIPEIEAPAVQRPGELGATPADSDGVHSGSAGIPTYPTTPPAPLSDALYRGDCRVILPQLPAASVQLIVTSPPYNVGSDYGDGGAGDRLPMPEYRALLEEALAGCYRALRPGGVLALNLPRRIRVPKEEPHGYPIAAWAEMFLRDTGWLGRGSIVWVKSKTGVAAYGARTPIGGPRNPFLRPCHEVVLLASKETYCMEGKPSKRWPGDREDFDRYQEWCKDVWHLPPGRAVAGQPVAFPDELVVRLVELYSEPGDIVLDPFAGTGTVGRIARQLGRRAWLIERNAAYWPRLEELLAAPMSDNPGQSDQGADDINGRH